MSRPPGPWVDAHCHPSDDRLSPGWRRRTEAAGVAQWISVESDPRQRDAAHQAAGSHPFVAGLHPWFVDQLSPHDAQKALDDLAQRPRLAGVGEIGLDRLHGPLGPQEDLFRRALSIARDRDLPVVLHCVRAWPELVAILQRDGLPTAGGMVHDAGVGLPLASQLVGLGLHLSFSPRALRRPKVLQAFDEVPLDHVLLESDSPDGLLPGHAQEPSLLPALASQLAPRRGLNGEELLHATTGRTKQLFRML